MTGKSIKHNPYKIVQMFEEEIIKLIRWSISLHEIGMFVAFSGYHKHGNYLISNADLSGLYFRR